MRWRDAFDALERQRKRGGGSTLTVPRELVGSPARAGALPASSLEMVTRGPKPRRAWRFLPLADGGSYHVLEFRDHYTLHRDAADPRFDLGGHVVRDIAAPLLERLRLPLPRLARVRAPRKKTS